MGIFRKYWIALFLISSLSLAESAVAATLNSAPSQAFTIPNGGFETPALPTTPGYQYNPTGSGWTFVNSAGLSRNGTAFTGTQVAPQGAQVLFLQGVGSASRTLDFTAGYYVFRFSAAQRANIPSTQRIELRIDGVSIQVFTPPDAIYREFRSDWVPLSSGPHSIELRGLNPQGNDSTAFVDDFRATREPKVIGDFESPALPASTYSYAPAGGPWTFNGLSGLSRNSSGFTSANPIAPEGSQVLFLQGPSSASTTITIPREGFYRLRFRAALRANNPTQPPSKNIRVTLGGTQVGEFRLTSSLYSEHLSTVRYLQQGNNIPVSLVGVDTAQGDHTGLVDNLQLEWIHDWQDPYVWGGVVPGPSDDAIIPANSTVCMQASLTPKSITVGGQLLGVQNLNVSVTTKQIMVMGSGALLELGQELTPYLGSAVFTLNATPADPDITMMDMNMGKKFIAAMSGAVLRLHGRPRVSWTQLGANVSAGSSTVVLKEPVDWQPGDSIVVVSSRENWNEAEKRTIASVQPGNTTLTLSSPLQYPHTGVVKSYTNGTRTWTADLRAQVGLLTHNIKVQGDAASASSGGFGGHIMMMDTAAAYVSGVELFNMGQKSIVGRYPFHWHMQGSAGEGQYFKNSSIHQSYNRAITIHGTWGTLVENNFFYDHIGHGVFLEDGSEQSNIIRRNVTLLTKRPAPGEQVTTSDNQFVNELQNRTPASYWITNPNNIFEDNVAAGTEGTGFWFAFPRNPMGESAKYPTRFPMLTWTEPLGLFRGNSAHSTMTGFDIFDGLTSGHAIVANEGWPNWEDHVIENSTWYANDMAIYTGIGFHGPTHNLIFRNNVLVENVVGTMFASYSRIEDSVFVANSGENLVLVDRQRSAYRVYDGAGEVRNSHFIGWDAANANFLINTGAAIKHPNHRFTGNTTSPVAPPRIILENFDIPPVVAHDNHPGHPRYWSIVLRDVDGGISGKPNTSIVSSHPFLRVGDEFQPSNWQGAFRSDHRFVLSRLTYGVTFEQTPIVTCLREKAGTAPVTVLYVVGYREWHQLPFIVNEGFEYTYTYDSLPSVKTVTMNMEDATVGDNYIARFKNFANLGGLSLSSSQGNFPAHASLASLRGAVSSGYFLQPGGDLYIKAVATGPTQSFTINWTTDFAVPPLDTDGDQMKDSDEVLAARHPFNAADLGAEFAMNGSFEGWTAFADITSQSVSNGRLTGTSSNTGDARIVNSDYNFSASRVPQLQVRMHATQNTGVQVYYATDTQPGFSSTRVVTASYTGNGTDQTLVFNMAGQAGWNGTITDLRLDPVAGVGIQFNIDWIRGPGL